MPKITFIGAGSTVFAKNLLVDCDEQGAQKISADPRQRVSDLLAHVARRRQDAGHRETVAKLKQNQFDPEQEAQELAALFDDLKRRQTGSPPTDG